MLQTSAPLPGASPANFGPGGSDLRVDSLYPGANAEWLMSCAEDVASGNIYQTGQIADTYSNVDNEMFTLDATWTPDGPVGPFENASLQIQGGWRYSSYNYYQDRDYGLMGRLVRLKGGAS